MANPMAIKRCGTCHFGIIVNQDITKRLCHGAPPSAIQMPIPRTPGGMTLQMARPVVSVSDMACALYREKDSLDKETDEYAIRQLQAGEGAPELKQ